MLIDKTKEISELLKVLGNDNRLIIVCLLTEKSLTVSEIHERLNNVTQSALSQHLAILKAHRIVASNKCGLNITYSIKDLGIIKTLEALKANYCD